MYINATGYYIPTERVTNDYFFEVNGLTSDWILQRTGIKTRSKAAKDETMESMGIKAIQDAITKLPYSSNDIDLVIAASYSPLDTVATLAHVAQREFKIENAKALYLSSACSSFTNAVEVAEAYFLSGKATKALIVCSEHNTYYSNDSDPKAGHLWGDAAVAICLSKEPQKEGEAEVIEVHTHGLGHIGKGPQGVMLRPRDEGISMPDGRDVFINACKYMVETLEIMTSKHNMAVENLNYIICHQANMRIVANIAHQLKLSDDHFLNNIEELGNTGSASSMLVLAQNIEKMQPNDLVALTVFGGGYSCGGVLIKF